VSGFEQDPTFVGKSFEQSHTQYTHNPALIGSMPCTGAAMYVSVCVNIILQLKCLLDLKVFCFCCRYLSEQMKEVGMVKVDQNTEVPLSTVVGKIVIR